jgi:hypothetical protein
MTLADWQFKVLEERKQLAFKVRELNDWLATVSDPGGSIPAGLNLCELGLMLAQRDAMTNYLNLLERRIERFPPR